jgi:hypothetical protein
MDTIVDQLVSRFFQLQFPSVGVSLSPPHHSPQAKTILPLYIASDNFARLKKKEEDRKKRVRFAVSAPCLFCSGAN